MSTHNLCFRVKIRKNVYPCTPQFHFIKVGCMGVFITRTSLHDDNVYPLASAVYVVKLGFTGVYIYSYFCSKT